MITKTFSFFDGIGIIKDDKLKRIGINCWDDFLHTKIGFLSKEEKLNCDNEIKKAKYCLSKKYHHYFLKKVPIYEQWKLYRYFRNNACFLDIETTGLDPTINTITTVALYDGDNSKIFVKEENLTKARLKAELDKYKMIVTFNGIKFDMPFIKAQFPGIKLNHLHMDLRFAAKSIGLTGGLKRIEKEFGLRRETKGVDGQFAVKLWHRWVQLRDNSALQLLIKYNLEDTVNLKLLADKLYEKTENFQDKSN